MVDLLLDVDDVLLVAHSQTQLEDAVFVLKIFLSLLRRFQLLQSAVKVTQIFSVAGPITEFQFVIRKLESKIMKSKISPML